MRAKISPAPLISLAASMLLHGLLLVSLRVAPAAAAREEPEVFLSLVIAGLREPSRPAETPARHIHAEDAADPEAAEDAEEAGRADEAPALADARGTAENAGERAAEYARRNYSYIQRRIRDRLAYPPMARKAGIQGVTEVGFMIHEDGSVSGVTVRASSGHALLDAEAAAAVFAAAPFPKPPAPARIVIPIAFRLR